MLKIYYLSEWPWTSDSERRLFVLHWKFDESLTNQLNATEIFRYDVTQLIIWPIFMEDNASYLLAVATATDRLNKIFH